MATQAPIHPEVRELLDGLTPRLWTELRKREEPLALVVASRRARPENARHGALEAMFYGALPVSAVCALAAHRAPAMIPRLRSLPPAGEIWCLVMSPHGTALIHVPRPPPGP